jgi:outer membrane immunogenic protein
MTTKRVHGTLAAAIAAGLLFAAPTAAQDLKDGAYIRGGLGLGSASHDINVANGSAVFNDQGSEGGLIELGGGYDWTLANGMRLGIGADLWSSNIDTDLSTADFGFNTALAVESGIDVYVRAGTMLSPATLVYGLAGVSFANAKVTTDTGLESSESTDGIVVGLGMETALNDDWSLTTEFRHAEYDTDTESAGLPISADSSLSTIRLALGFRF